MSILYLLAIIALLISTGAVSMALIKTFPVRWLYYHFFIGRPVVWAILIGALVWTYRLTEVSEVFPKQALLPLFLMALAVLLSHKARQNKVFQAIDFPALSNDPRALPLSDEMQLAVIEHRGVSKAYPLNYVAHHHIVNDRFGDQIVSLTYCAMCRTVIPFNVTDIGPLFVASFKNANMIVADRKTRTFFQQATFESIIGHLHPHTLTMMPFQTFSWGDLKTFDALPQIVQVTEQDLREFELPIPGLWKKINDSEATPGLPARQRDEAFPARTRVVGTIDRSLQTEVVYLKSELMSRRIVHNKELKIYLIAVNSAVNGFRDHVGRASLSLVLNPDTTISDISTETCWDLRGRRLHGEIELDLEPIALSDEFWFSWRQFHPASELIRM